MTDTIKLDYHTKLQVCWIMLLFGSEAQKQEAAEWLSEQLGANWRS